MAAQGALNIGEKRLPDGFLDASSFEFDKVERTTLSLSEDEEVTLRFDVKRDFDLAEGTFTFQTDRLRSEQWAVFGEARYDITDRKRAERELVQRAELR